MKHSAQRELVSCYDCATPLPYLPHLCHPGTARLDEHPPALQLRVLFYPRPHSAGWDDHGLGLYCSLCGSSFCSLAGSNALLERRSELFPVLFVSAHYIPNSFGDQCGRLFLNITWLTCPGVLHIRFLLKAYSPATVNNGSRLYISGYLWNLFRVLGEY